MITPEIKGGHEVTQPVYVEGAEVGDAVAISILSIKVTSKATASGNETIIDGRFLGDPYVAAKCPKCDVLYPKTVVSGVGEGAVRCENCGESVSPFAFTHGYTIAFDDKTKIGVTVDRNQAECFAKDAKMYAAMPECSVPTWLEWYPVSVPS
jgi:acetamidase/formamidase